ncbi:CheY chemotaxis protein or a CheY-like REC (receiver) domain [Devosia crocina]|uniref:CheY chemotaxis protein or a CheY-like REC (Receiver) domain n=2 Tax=Devosia crocina TaxID=429728 RepID=A0A1I7NLB2_9HYPH|nr:CheY chemotaxis protein or a CheY-like REC (receiver) domain [Devosia crocina]
MSGLGGRRVLIVEDEYMLAMDLVEHVSRLGAEVFGPVASLNEAEQLVRSGIDCAVLDINVRGEMSFGLADNLARHGVPFVFATGYECAMIPERFSGVKCCTKPCLPQDVAAMLASLFH